jgi:hypothetical protein
MLKLGTKIVVQYQGYFILMKSHQEINLASDLDEVFPIRGQASSKARASLA